MQPETSPYFRLQTAKVVKTSKTAVQKQQKCEFHVRKLEGPAKHFSSEVSFWSAQPQWLVAASIQKFPLNNDLAIAVDGV